MLFIFQLGLIQIKIEQLKISHLVPEFTLGFKQNRADKIAWHYIYIYIYIYIHWD